MSIAFSKEYGEIIKIILTAKDVDGLSRLMRAYMSLYEQYRENKKNVQFYRSDQVFLILVEQSGNLPVGKRDLFEDYATRIEGSDKDHSLRKRFLDLSDTVQSQVTFAIKSVRKKRQTGKSILDILKDEYVKRYGYPPKTHDDLYEFDPAPSDYSLRKAFDASVARCEVCWRQTTAARPIEKTYRELDSAFDQFASFLHNKAADPLPFFQVLKWIREGSTYRRPNPDYEPQNVQSVTWSIIWDEVYLETCFHGLRMARTRWNLLAVQTATELLLDDRKFFLAPYSRHPQEAEKLALRLKHGLRNVPEFIAVHRARRRDNRFAAYAGLDLLDELQVRDLLNQIQRARESRPSEVSKMVIQVLSEHAAFQDRYRIGQNIMDDFTIVWIEKDDPYRRTRAPLDDKVIIEFHNRDCTLFRTNSAGLGRLVKNAFYKTLARNAQALTVFMLAYLELIGLVVDVITAGVAGGFRRVLFELVKERIKEKAVDAALDNLGVDHPVVRTVAGMGANLVHLPTKTRVPGKPDPNFNPKKQRAEALDKGSTLDKFPSARKAPANENTPMSRSPGGEVDTPDLGIIGMDAYKQRQQARQRAEEVKRAAEISEANRINQHARMSRASGDLGGGRAGFGHVDSDVSAPSTGGRSSGTSGSRGTQRPPSGVPGTYTMSSSSGGRVPTSGRKRPPALGEAPHDQPLTKGEQRLQSRRHPDERMSDELLRRKEIEELFYQKQERFGPGAQDEALAGLGGTSMPTPGGKRMSTPVEAGLFVHTPKYAEALRGALGNPRMPAGFSAQVKSGDLIKLADLPDGLRAEVGLGITSRADRLTIVDGVVYELKPNTGPAIEEGLSRVPEYVALARENYPEQRNWRGVVVVYDRAEARRLMAPQ